MENINVPSYNALNSSERRIRSIQDLYEHFKKLKTSVDAELERMEEITPEEASASNKLADKNFVNDAVATVSAAYRGSYNLVSDLSLTTSATKSDIATALASAVSNPGEAETVYVQIPIADATPTKIDHEDRYKYNGTSWEYEYSPNASPIDGVFDISAYNNNTAYADLASALGINGANVPQSVRKGGMMIRFVQSSDNNYVKFFCTADEFTTDVTKWQGVDDEPKAGSKNLVESGGTLKSIMGIAGKIQSYAAKLNNSYFTTTGGTSQGGSTVWDGYRYDIEGAKKVYVEIGNKKGSLDTIAIVSFCSGYISAQTLLSNIAIQNGEFVYKAVLDVPEGTKYLYISNQKTVLPEPLVYVRYDVEGKIVKLQEDVTDIIENTERLDDSLTGCKNVISGIESQIGNQVSSISDFTKTENVYVSSAGIASGSNLWDRYVLQLSGEEYIDVTVGNKNSGTDVYLVSFFTSATINIDNIISAATIVCFGSGGIYRNLISVPSAAKSVAICCQKSELANPIINGYVSKFTKIEEDFDDLASSVKTNISTVSDFTKTQNVCVTPEGTGYGSTVWDRYTKTIDGEQKFEIELGNKKGSITVYIVSFFTSEEININNVINESIIEVQDTEGIFKVIVNVPASAKSIAVCNQKTVLATPVINGYSDLSGTVEKLQDNIETISEQMVEVNTKLSIPVFEQGGIAQGSGSLISSSARIRSNYLMGNFELSVKDGYEIRLVAAYKENGDYLWDLAAPLSGRDKICISNNKGTLARIVVNKVGDSNILPTEDFIDSFIGGDTYETQVINVRPAVEVGYVYNDTVPSLPTSADDIYAVWNELLEKYPQYVSREQIGTSRKTVTFTFDSLDNVPMILSCNTAIEVGTTVYINGNSSKSATVEDVFLSFDGIYFTKIKALNGVDTLGSSGTLTNVGGTTLATYSEVLCGKVRMKMNGTQIVDCAFVNRTTMIAKGAPLDESSSIPVSGYVIDEDGITIGNYDSLSTSNGEPIYCYTVDFCKNDANNLGRGVKNNIFALGGVHGYERKAALGITNFFKQLFINWRNDKYLTEIRNAAKFTVIPCVNPFGIREQKNYNARGVDLNRNFSYGFVEYPQYYFRWSGPSAFSEPEAIAVRDKMLACANYTNLMIDFHGEDGFQGSYIRTPFVPSVFLYGLIRGVSTLLHKEHNIPTYCFAWKNGTDVKYTDSPIPEVGDRVLTNSSVTEYTISAVASGSITVNGIVYSRYSTGDIDHTTMLVVSNAFGGMTTVYAASIGMKFAVCPEVDTGYYLDDAGRKKVAIELIGNYIYAAIKYFMYV